MSSAVYQQHYANKYTRPNTLVMDADMVVYIFRITDIFLDQGVGLNQIKEVNDLGNHLTTMGLMALICGTLLWALIKVVNAFHAKLKELNVFHEERANQMQKERDEYQKRFIFSEKRFREQAEKHEKELINKFEQITRALKD